MTRTLTPNMFSRTASVDDMSDDFIVVDEPEPTGLAFRPKTPAFYTPPPSTPPSYSTLHQQSPRLEINSIEFESSFLVSFHPPASPPEQIDHVPTDIVLVIDVSGSMAELAPLPDVDDEQERAAAGLTILDLVRHMCRAIISTLNKHDRLALITFSQDAKVKMGLTHMTKRAKAEILSCVESLTDEGATNLWAGIKTGLQQFEQNPPVGNVQALYVLTDGMPNYMCPLPGYVPKLQPIMDGLARENGSKPVINTFGFGCTIQSDLMLSIAKVGHGNFSFISDVGMIGTIFVHAVANLYSTYATNALLELTFDELGTDDITHTSGLPFGRLASDRVAIQLGSVQYGQSRDLIVKCRPDRFRSKAMIHARLTCERSTTRIDPLNVTHALIQPSALPRTTLDYHFARYQLCSFFSTLFPLDGHILQHKYVRDIDIEDDEAEQVDSHGNSIAFYHLVHRVLNMSGARTDSGLQSLIVDLIGPSLKLTRRGSRTSSGQIHQALDTRPQQGTSKNPYGIFKTNWEKWGHHYLASLWCAHMRQICNSFKDAGPLQYSCASTLFNKCKAELDNKFDELEPPKGTWRGLGYQRIGRSPIRNNESRPCPPISMKRYNCVDNSCMLGTCKILLADGSQIKLEDLRKGMKIWNSTLQTAKEVKEIVKSNRVAGGEICRVGNSELASDASLWITSWHPIQVSDSHSNSVWTFPKQVLQQTRTLKDGETVYSILLEPDDNVDAHAVTIENVTCVTLGHGVTALPDGGSDIRAHPFFGNYDTVIKSLETLPVDENGHRLCGGLVRDTCSGLAFAFVPAFVDAADAIHACSRVRDEVRDLRARL